MQLHIRHMTHYRYERPVKYSVQSLHLTPRRDAGQRALSWTIAAPGRRLEQIDAHGNIAHLLTIEQPHREIQIVVRGVVETADIEGRQDDGPLSPLAYLAPTTLTAQNEEIKSFARDAVVLATEPRARAEALAEAVVRAVRYKPGVSDVQDTAATVKGYARITPTCTSPRRDRWACRHAT
jgi:transglutaminase-like putative cysteine protease